MSIYNTQMIGHLCANRNFVLRERKSEIVPLCSDGGAGFGYGEALGGHCVFDLLKQRGKRQAVDLDGGIGYRDARDAERVA